MFAYDPTPADREGVAFVATPGRLTLRATHDLSDLAVGAFAKPSVHIRIDASAFGDRARFTGFGFTQFAMPVRASTDRPFVWNPADNVFSPPAVMPLAVERPDGGSVLLAPLSAWHEQIVGVEQNDRGVQEFHWGWHGDLDTVPEGFETTLGVYEGRSVAELFARWGSELCAKHRVERHCDDPLMTHLSYWTDNGAAYWYRTEPGLDIATTLENKLAELDEMGIEIGSVELDSWFYQHEVSRPITEMGPLEEVPPTGMIEWQPRADVLPDGVGELQRRLGRPLALHSRHIAASSPVVDDDWWVDLCAHPIDQSWFDRWFERAQSWGATCIEQDWMLLYWFGVRQLREHPGRAAAWLQALDTAAAERDMAIILCMAMPGDMIEAARLDRMIALRTCDDYRFADDPARLWGWYLTVNRLAAALGIPAFKDCFFTATDPGDSGLDGDPHAEVESVLAAFSGGIVGIGDRIGCTDTSIVARLVDDDGRIATTDAPLALCDTSFFDEHDEPTATWSEAWIGDTRYVVALHLAATKATLQASLELPQDQVVYDWRRGTAHVATELVVNLSWRDWALFVCAPMEGLPGERTADLGDVSRYATLAGAHRSTTRWVEGQGLIAAPV